MATNYTGNVTPSLSNAPASSWTDDAAKRSHVGNTYLVTGSGGTAGNVYAFEEYAAPLVKQASGLPADIVTLTDGGEDLPMTKAEASLSPIQSLNGYDHPWAGGAGKNKFNVNNVVNVSNISVSDGKITVDGNARNSTKKLSELADVIVGETYIITATVTGGNENIIYLYGANVSWAFGTQKTITQEIADSLVLFYGGAGTTSVISDFMIRLSSVADATFAPYSNLCPITGHDSATLNVLGKNQSAQSSVTSTATGNVNNNSGHFGNCKAGLEYTFSFDVLVQNSYAVRVRFNNGSNLKSWATGELTVGSRKSFTYTPTEDGYFNFNTGSPAFPASTKVFDNVQVELGSTPTAFVPYNPSSASVTASFPQTVYGGTFDWVSGKLVVDMAMVDLGTLTWIYDSGNTCFYAAVDGMKVYDYQGAVAPKYISSQYKPIAPLYSGGDGQNGTIWATVNTNNIRARDTAYADAATFKTAMSGVQLVYELATPIEIDLTSAQVQTLFGLNNVWASDGQISALTYQSNQFIPKYDWFETWNMPKITRNNGSVIVLPYPKEYTPEIHDVDAATTGRNAAGTMIRDRVAIKHKFNYVFPPLSQADATELLAATKDASFTLTTASPETGAKTNYRVYAGDKSLPVYWMPNHDTASWLYSSVSVNLIEM